MAGLAGIVLALLALIDQWRAPENSAARHNLLVIAAVLLSLSFVFAPFVRRAFGVLPRAKAQRDSRKTLLDELREGPQRQSDEKDLPYPPALEPDEKPAPIVRLIIVLYAAFGATLIVVMLALR